MILYVDETENEKYFIVAGLLVTSKSALDGAYKSFKKSIRGYNIRDKFKSELFTEFKSVLLDNTYPRIKKKMLQEILSLEDTAIFSCYIKKDYKFNQILKESIYITLLSNIIAAVDQPCEVVFDGFGKKDFENNIVSAFSNNDTIIGISPEKSENQPGLQFVDNICSVIRLHKSEDEKDLYYGMIESMLREV